MTQALQSLPRLHFIRGPGALWAVPAEGWTPATVWDLLVKPRLFVLRPASGRRPSSLRDTYGPPRSLDRDRQPPSQTADIDPCYFSPAILPPRGLEVAVLPAIQEDEWYFSSEPRSDESPSVNSCNVVVHPLDHEVEYHVHLECAAIHTID